MGSAAAAIGTGLVLEATRAAAVTQVTAAAQSGAAAPISIASDKLVKGSCGVGFRPHTVQHTTQAHGLKVLPYDTNGSGLALGDLDDDGRVDLVLGDLRAETSVLWNDGGFRFTRRALDGLDGRLPESDTRALQTVDVDGDGRLDIVTTHTGGGLSVWHNNGGRSFTSTTIDEVIAPAYAMMWDDLDGDGDLDFVTASYDALLEKEQGNSFLNSAGGGVIVYVNTANGFRATRLERKTQSLAMTLFDINGDGRRDLVVGNDFGVPDMIWTVKGSDPSKWSVASPFKRITKNTMGFAVGDVGNNGMLDLFATDMKPNLADVKVAASWMPLMERSFQKLQRTSTQRAENVLELQTRTGRFTNTGYVKHIDATGWSWSAQFGDLDNDGNEDLYVVNGMIDHEVLPYLPNGEIKESNVVFRVDKKGGFRRTSSWGLDSTASGRSMALADLNGDGRLDVVVNNLRSPSIVYENQLCGGASMNLTLHWKGHQNSAAFGAVVRVETDHGTLTRLVTPTGGYLTGLDGTVHFGLGTRKVKAVSITWPDGAPSMFTPSSTSGGLSGQLVTVTRNG
jgi:enediyne biosynthesis protein E4